MKDNIMHNLNITPENTAYLFLDESFDCRGFRLIFLSDYFDIIHILI